MLQLTDRGLYCAAGNFYIDPWGKVERAVITHAHGDHARRGMSSYLTTHEGKKVLQTRMGADAAIQSVAYGETVGINGVRVSLHPAGHILGSAQIRVESGGEIWVVSGDYKTEPDVTCTPFEVVQCHTFITESTFGLPIYHWRPQAEVFAAINAWWRGNAAKGKASILYGYALGKAQRLLAGVDPAIGAIYTHGAVERLNADYRMGDIPLPPTTYIVEASARGKKEWAGSLIVAPPSAHGTPWMRKFGTASTGFASGWMQVRGKRRQKAVDRGFVLSDHVDWQGLNEAIKATGAQNIWVTHGYTNVVVRWLIEQGYNAQTVETTYGDEEVLEAAENNAEPGIEPNVESGTDLSADLGVDSNIEPNVEPTGE